MVNAPTMKLTSPAFVDGDTLPARYAADGDNHSPPVAFENVPPTARSLALTMENRDASDAPFAHWIMFDISPLITGLAQAEIAGRYRDGLNGFRELGYTGPHSPELHRYVFTLYALDARLDLPNGTDLRQLRQAMAGHEVDTAELSCTYRCSGPFASAATARTKAPLA